MLCARSTTWIGIYAPGNVGRTHWNSHMNAIDHFNIIKILSSLWQSKLSLCCWLAETSCRNASSSSIVSTISSLTVWSSRVTASFTCGHATPNNVKVLCRNGNLNRVTFTGLKLVVAVSRNGVFGKAERDCRRGCDTVSALPTVWVWVALGRGWVARVHSTSRKAEPDRLLAEVFESKSSLGSLGGSNHKYSNRFCLHI